VIIDLQKFLAAERGYWTELEGILDALEANPDVHPGLERLKRFHYLYERASADLARITTFASEPDLVRYLESLVARAYGEIHETREKPHRFRPLHWFFHTFPRTFRRRAGAFWLSVAITAVGCAFGAFAVGLDPDAKRILLPFGHGEIDPARRVATEEKVTDDRLKGSKSTFSTFLMANNIRVSITTLALGITWGVGTMIMLFQTGIMLGGIAVDYVAAGQTPFLVGWLLPHGSVEIPAILIAGQAGLILGSAVIGWGRPISLSARLREVTGDLTTLIFGVATLLVWAGLIEAFFSQYHEPALPYSIKIGFGLVELVLLTLFLAKSGGDERPATDRAPGS
jgi:uncharacterized membrane protein SpoIIM required for sporulation